MIYFHDNGSKLGFFGSSLCKQLLHAVEIESCLIIDVEICALHLLAVTDRSWGLVVELST
jgi:hypothetical protein